MQILLILMLLLGGSQGHEDQQMGRVSLYDDYEDFSQSGAFGKQSQQSDILRPCSIPDINCIRRYFAHRSGCLPVQEPASEPYKMKQLARDIPHLNVTITMNDAQIFGLNSGKIIEFYINNRTNTLLLEVEFFRFVVISTNTVARYHRNGREPITTSDFFFYEHRQLSLTWTIDNNEHKINPNKGHVFGYISDSIAPLIIGPELQLSKGVPNYVNWSNNITLTLQEILVEDGSTYFSAYMQNVICDFKHKHDHHY